MFCGRITPPRNFRYSLSASGSVGGSALVPEGYAGTVDVLYEPDYIVLNLGLRMSVSHQMAASGTGSATIDGDLTGYHAVSAASSGAPAATFDFLGRRIYELASGVIRLAWDSLEWRVNGVVEWTGGAGSLDSGIASCAASVPIMGIYPEVEASVIVPKFAPSSPAGGGAPTGGTVTYAGSCTATCSWEFDALDGDGYVTGGTKTVNAETNNVGGGGSATNDIYFERDWVVPTWATGVVRMEGDTLSLPFRQALPESKLASTDMTEDYSGGLPPPPGVYPVVTGGTTYTTVLPAYSQFLEVVGDTAGTIEDPLSETAPGPYFHVRQIEYFETGLVRTVQTISERFGPYTPQGQCAPYLDHDLWQARIMNTWLHPLWSYGDGMFGSTAEWNSMGDQDYYLPERQQQMSHAALPPSDDNDRRNFMVSSCIDQNGITGLIQSAIGCYSFWGTSQFETLNFDDAPTEILLDARSADRWTFRGDGSIGGTGTGTVDGGGVAIDAPGTTVDFGLGSYDVWPYMVLRRFNSITLPAISDANVAKVQAFLIGADGASVLIGETTGTQATFTIPRARGIKHGGSWGHDAGGGWGTDTFAPSYDPAGDVSLAVAGDPELSGGYPFLPFGAGTRIRFVLTPVDPADPVSMGYPTFNAPAWADLASYADASAFRTILGADAPAIRWGTGTHYDPGLDALVNPPLAHNPIDRALELGDGKVWGNLWVYGKAWDEDLSAELGDLYEEGVEWTMLRHFWRDPFEQARVTHSFMAPSDLGPAMCLVNSYRAIPPLGMDPIKERTAANGWKAEGDYGMWTYLLSPSRRPHITTSEPTLEKPLGADTLTGTESAPSGWDVRYHRIVVDGTEGYGWFPASEGKAWAKVRPWRGFVWWSGFRPDTLGRLLALASRGDGRLFRLVETEEGTARIDTSWAAAPTGWSLRDTGIPVEGGDIRTIKGTNAVAVAIIADGTLTLSLTRDEGRSLEGSVDLGDAEAVTLVDAGDGRLYAAKVDGGTVVVSLHATKDAAQIGGPWTTNLTGLSDGTRIDGDGIRLGGNRFALLLATASGGTPTLHSSSDGRTFD